LSRASYFCWCVLSVGVFFLKRIAILAGFVLLVALSADPLAETADPRFTYLYPRIAFEDGWTASVVVVNVGQAPTNVQLFAYDAGGILIQETSRGLPLEPGERRVYFMEDGAWPEGTASLKVESDSPLLSIALLESTDERGLEAILPVTTPNAVLTFPLIEKNIPWWSHLVLLNAGSVETDLEIVALDSEGNRLAEALLPTLSPMASSTVIVGELFESSILASTAVVQVVADQPVAGVQLSGSEDRTDVASVSAPLGQGQRLFLPVFQQVGIMTLWSRVGLFNPHDEPVNITVEAFDSQNRPLGSLSNLTSLAGLSSAFFSTRNIGGSMAPDTVSLSITTDQPISGYSVTGALDAQGLTAIQALTENDSASDYEILGSADGNVLVAIPVLVESESGEIDSDYLLGTVVEDFGLTAADESSSLADIELNGRPGAFQESLSANGADHSFTFTDDPLLDGAIVKAIHFTELGEVINILRTRLDVGLSEFEFTDLTRVKTTIQEIHIIDLRGALNALYDQIDGLPSPSYEEIIAEQTVIKKSHIEKIRKAAKDADLFQITVDKAGAGSGTVTDNFGATFDTPLVYDFNASVTLTVTASPGSTFAGWGGDCSSFEMENTCSLTMNSNKTVTAAFNLVPQNPN